MITLISKMLIVKQDERISLQGVINKFKLFAKRIHPYNSRPNANNSRPKANNSRPNANNLRTNSK